ncbi:MAG TPA: YtcA family lipoprotein [Steroidobacteraceae bacterium]
MRIFRTTRGGALSRDSSEGGRTRGPQGLLLAALVSLGGCNGAPSRNILGSYFPSWMVCALIGIAVAGITRAIFKASGILPELPVPFVVFLAIGCAATFTLWLIWLA